MGLSGHLDLVCGLDSRGWSSLRRQSFRAPMHISKPYLEGPVLVVNVINPTAGLLADDRIISRVEVESGARLLLATPSASRAHRMRGGSAEVRQEFRIADGGFLEIWPELFIPQGGAHYRQKTELHLAKGAEAIFFESLAPGRVASGEAFAYESLDWEMDVHLAEHHLARERYQMRPGGPEIQALRSRFETAYYASCFVVSSRLGHDSPCWQQIHDLHEPEAWIGVSRLAHGGWVIKLLAASSILLRRKLRDIRREIYAALGEAMPGLRRAGEGV